MTHEGSGLGHCEGDLKNICKGAIFVNGLAVRGTDSLNSEKIVVEWAEKNT